MVRWGGGEEQVLLDASTKVSTAKGHLCHSFYLEVMIFLRL